MARSYTAKQRKSKVSIVGGKEIARRLKNMGNEASKVLLSAARKGGDIALKDAKDNCPTDTGALKASLKLSDNKVSKTKADVKIDYDKTIKYGVFVELGAKGRQANPFLRNAVDNNIDKINKTIAEEVAKAVGRKM